MIRKQFLASEISYRYPDVTIHLSRPDDEVDRPLFLDGTETHVGARIYIARTTELPREAASTPQALFLCIGSPRAENDDRFDRCSFPQNTDVPALFNFVQRVFDRFDQWERAMRAIAERGESAEEMLDCAAQMLQNPVLLCDSEGRILAAPEQYLAETEPLDCALSYNLTHAVLASMDKIEAPQKLSYGGGELLLRGFTAERSAYCAVVLMRDRALYESDETILALLCGFLKLVLPVTSVQAKEQIALRREKLLRALLETGDVSESDWQNELLPSIDGAFACAILSITTNDYRQARTRLLCERLANAIEGSVTIVLDAEIVWMLPCKDETALLLRVEEIAESEGLCGGLSEAFIEAAQIEPAIRQAQIAERFAREKGAYLLPFCAIASDALTNTLLESIPRAAVCLPSVMRMADFDATHDTRYCETLRTYIANRFNAIRTANALYIHRSTFLYRLDRIHALFGLDLEQEQDWLRLLISLRIVHNDDRDTKREN